MAGTSIVTLLRLLVLAVVTVFAVIVLGVAAHMINVTTTGLSFYWSFSALGVATAALTLVTLPALALISIMRKGALPNFIIIETAWFTVLWILWLATASNTASATAILPTSCNFNIFIYGKEIACREFQVLQAFSWLNWIILMGYVGLCIVLTIVQQMRGNSVFFKSVNEVDFFAPAASAGMAYQTSQVQQPTMMAPQQQQTMPQQQMAMPPSMPYPPSATVSPSSNYATPPTQTPVMQGSYPQV